MQLRSHSLIACSLFSFLACGPGALPAERPAEDQPASVTPAAAPACASLVPAADAASFTRDTTLAAGDSCGSGTTDGSGAVAVLIASAPQATQYETDRWDVLDSAGAPSGSFTGYDAARFFPLASGFQAIQDDGCGSDPSCRPGQLLRTLTSRGEHYTQTALTNFRTVSAGADPNGGVLIAGVRAGLPDLELDAQRFDQFGGPRSPVAQVSALTRAPAVVLALASSAGDSLVLWEGAASGFADQTLAGRWLSATGVPLGDIFIAATGVTAGSELKLWPLLDGSVVLHGPSGWLARFQSGSAAPAAVPDWLASRPAARPYPARSGQAYALVTPPAAGSCAPIQVEIVLPDGQVCGQVQLAVQSGQGCSEDASIGKDGSLVAHAGQGASCRQRVWPALVR